MQVNFTYPTVILSHSSLLSDFNCYAPQPDRPLFTQLQMTINTLDAFNTVHSTWLGKNNLVLVTDGDGCSVTGNNSRSYYLGYASNVVWNDGNGNGYFTFFGDEILVQQGLANADLVWGTAVANATGANTTAIDAGNSNSTLCEVSGYDPSHPSIAHINPCTPNFDAVLDATIGYKYIPSDDRWSALFQTEFDSDGAPNLVRVHNNAVAAAEQQNEGWFTTVAGDLEDFVVSAAQGIADYIDSWIPRIPDGTLGLSMQPQPVVESPWGDAFQIYQYKSGGDEGGANEKRETTKAGNEGSVTVYCVDCGVKSTVEFTGSASFSLSDGVTSLSVGMDGSIDAGVNLGVVADFKHTFPGWSTNLGAPQGVPILEVPGVIVVGPIIELKAELELAVSAEGKVLTGASLSIPSFSANLDFINTDNTYANGFDDLQVNKYFTAEGEIAASATFSLPFSIGIGITLPPVDFDKQVKLEEKPGIKAEVAYKTSISSGTTPLTSSDDEDDNDCAGIEWGVTFVNEVNFNFFDLYEKQIADYESPPIVNGCFELGSAGNASTNSYGNSAQQSTDAGAQHGTSVIDSTKSFTIVSADDGNLYLQDPNAGTTTYFQNAVNANPDLPKVQTTTLIADDKGRSLYLFYDVMTAYGVSRIRALADDEVPSTAVPMVFGFGDIDDDSNTPDQYYVFADTASGFPYMPIACTVQDGQGKNATKLFAAQDVNQAMTTLTSSPQLAGSITGGTVSACAYLLYETWQTM